MVIKIRLHGTKNEIAIAKQLIKELFDVLYESEPYKDRGNSQYYRCYMDCDGKEYCDE